MNPVSAAWNTVARFDDYSSAQRAVDWLSDDGFPVEQLDIVGTDLRLVERVTGRLTKARAAAAGALSGMWDGLLPPDPRRPWPPPVQRVCRSRWLMFRRLSWRRTMLRMPFSRRDSGLPEY